MAIAAVRGRGREQKPMAIVTALFSCHSPSLLLLLCLLLSGVKCAVIEKSFKFSHHPQAHFINNRSMELFRKLDGLADDIQRLQPPVDLWTKFVYCTSLSGTILGSVDHMQPQDFKKVISPISVAHFSQYKLTGLLLKRLENIGFHVCTPTDLGVKHDIVFEKKILMGHECISINHFAQGLNVGTSFLRDGKLLDRKLVEEFDTYDPNAHWFLRLQFLKKRSKIIEIVSAKDVIFALAQSGLCAAFSRTTNRRICFLNISPDEVIRSLFYNKNNDSLITVSVYASDHFSSLKCRTTPIEFG